MITDVYLYYYKLILIQEESPCNETDKANSRQIQYLQHYSLTIVVSLLTCLGNIAIIPATFLDWP